MSHLFRGKTKGRVNASHQPLRIVPIRPTKETAGIGCCWSSFLIHVFYYSPFNENTMSIPERMQSPTPPFFQKLRNISIAMAAISSVVLTTPIVLPALIVKIAGYLAVAGAAAGAVSQAVVANPES
jgi:hypothetical protein